MRESRRRTEACVWSDVYFEAVYTTVITQATVRIFAEENGTDL